MIISLAISLIGPILHRTVDEDRTFPTLSTRDIHLNQCFSFDIYGANILWGQQIHIDLPAIVEKVPQLFDDLVWIIDSQWFARFIIDADYDRSSECVGECGVGWPEILGKTIFT